jgi:hypothetical protein
MDTTGERRTGCGERRTPFAFFGWEANGPLTCVDIDLQVNDLLHRKVIDPHINAGESSAWCPVV